MSNEIDFPVVGIAVTLLTCGDEFLLVYNRKWAEFTLPMTKKREIVDPKAPAGKPEDTWEDAAVRAAAEWLGCTTTESPILLDDDIPFYLQSDRDGSYKRYKYCVYKLDISKVTQLTQDAVTEWLPAAEILNEARRPISKSARHLISELLLRKKIADTTTA